MLRRNAHRLAAFAAWIVFVASVIFALAVAAFDATFGVQSDVAAVTAPQRDIRAPATGLVRNLGVRRGGVVARDDPLFAIDDPELDLAIAKARAEVSSPIMDGHAKRLAEAQLNALVARQALNTVYSPCDCVVIQNDGAAGGEWALRGKRTITLAPNDPTTLRVEARIPAHLASRLGAGQKVALTFPLTGETAMGAVERVIAAADSVRRAGAPDWYKWDEGRVSVTVRPDRPLSLGAIGQPVEMKTTNVTLRGLAQEVKRRAMDVLLFIGGA